MKRLIAIITLTLISATFCLAQDFLVYTVKGNITITKGNNIEKVVPGMTLKSTDKVNIPAESRLVILNESSKSLHTIKVSGNDILSKLLDNSNNTKQELTDSYLTFIKQKVSGIDDKKDKNYMQAAGTSYRDVNDSTIVNILIPNNTNNQ